MSGSITAGRLRQRIDIVRPVRTPTGRGGNTIVAMPIAAAVAAEVLALAGSEAVQERVLRGVRVYRITIRWRAGVLQSDQIAWDGEAQPINIRSAIDPDQRRRWLVIDGDTEA